ncbi:hypothetical protein XOCgx_2821 [Xanthomonas oryzae pv. oryzicola]|nr:hypothetical protein XOCgx_2821 [Xanthomonas oryzae pv. oryzicola]
MRLARVAARVGACVALISDWFPSRFGERLAEESDTEPSAASLSERSV